MKRVCNCRAFLIMLIVGPMTLQSLNGPVFANGPTVGRDSGAIFPLANTSLQLVYENVTAFISKDDFGVPVVCEYRLRNLTDKTQTVEMSFLINSEASPPGPDCDEDQYVQTYLYEPTYFVVLVNGREVPVETVPVRLFQPSLERGPTIFSYGGVVVECGSRARAGRKKHPTRQGKSDGGPS